MPPLIRVIHPAPAAAVVLLSCALALILDAGAGFDGGHIALVVLAVTGSQLLTGALNDWADRDRDAATGQAKPIPAGMVTPRTALRIAGAGALLQLAASLALGPAFLALGAVAATSAVAYDLLLSRSPASFVPYLVSFGILPLWIATGVGAPADRVVAAMPLAAAFAVAAHLANTLRDWKLDVAAGSRSVAHVLGRHRSRHVASAITFLVGVGVGAAVILGERGNGPAAAAWTVGIAAVVIGGTAERALWPGQLIAAVAWTVAWALSGAG